MTDRDVWDCYRGGGFGPVLGERPVIEVPARGAPDPPVTVWGAYLDSPCYPQRHEGELFDALSDLGRPPAIYFVGGEDDLRDRSQDTDEISLIQDLGRFGTVSTVPGSWATSAAALVAEPSLARETFIWTTQTFSCCLVAPVEAEATLGEHFHVLSALYSLWHDPSNDVEPPDREHYEAVLRTASAAFGCPPTLDDLEPCVVVSLLRTADWVIRKDGSDGEYAFLLARSRELVTRVRDAVVVR